MSAKTDSECPSRVCIPCKVWDADRALRKSLVVSSLDELISKAARVTRVMVVIITGPGDVIRPYMEDLDGGTSVVAPRFGVHYSVAEHCQGTIKLGLSPTEAVKVVLEEDGTEVEDEDYFSCLSPNTTFILLPENKCWNPGTSSVAPDETDFVGEGAQLGITEHLPAIVETIRGNPAKVIALSIEQMEVLVNADQQQLANMLRVPSRDAGQIQLNCQRYMDDRTKALDAITLLKTCDQSNKRQRTS